MAQPTIAEAIETLEEGHARVGELLRRLDDAAFEAPATIGGGDWSAKDLLGHLATWEDLGLRSLDEWRRGEMPWIERPEGVFSAPATGKVDAFNARTVAEFRTVPADAARGRAEDVHRRLVAALSELAPHEWTAKATYETPNDRRRRLGTLLGSILGAPQRPFGHAFAHLDDLRRYVDSAG